MSCRSVFSCSRQVLDTVDRLRPMLKSDFCCGTSSFRTTWSYPLRPYKGPPLRVQTIGEKAHVPGKQLDCSVQSVQRIWIGPIWHAHTARSPFQNPRKLTSTGLNSVYPGSFNSLCTPGTPGPSLPCSHRFLLHITSNNQLALAPSKLVQLELVVEQRGPIQSSCTKRLTLCHMLSSLAA
jgi:hypothetical protein